MGIVTFIYLLLWTVLLNYFENGASTQNMGMQFKSIASVMITQTGFQFSSMLMCLITIMLGAGIIASELETGMIHAIISRPIRRTEYVLGKLAGLFILVFIYASVLFYALLAVGAIFSLSTVTALTFLQILKSWLLYLLVPLIVLCLTVYGSVSFKTVPNGLLMIFIYILGNIGGMVEMIGKYIDNASVTGAGIFISLISPFHVLYSTAERALMPSTGLAGDLMRGAGGLSGSGQPPSVWMYVYIGFYALFFIVLSLRKFGKTDIT